MPTDNKVVVANINVPGSSSRVDAAKYYAAKAALLRVLPTSSPGLTQKDIQAAIQLHLPEDLFPGGKTSAWWAKTVQLDLEAKGIIVRLATKPLSWCRVVDA